MSSGCSSVTYKHKWLNPLIQILLFPRMFSRYFKLLNAAQPCLHHSILTTEKSKHTRKCYLCVYLLLKFKLHWWVSHDEYNTILYVTFTVKVPFSFYFIILIIFMLLNWIIPGYLNACTLLPQSVQQLRWVCPRQRWWLVQPIWKRRWPPAYQPMESPLVPLGTCLFFLCLSLAASQPTLTCCWLKQVGDERARRSEHPRVQKLWWDIHRSEWLHSSAQQRDTQGDAHLRYHLQRGGVHRQCHPWYSV